MLCLPRWLRLPRWPASGQVRPQLVDLEDYRIKDVGWSAWKLRISAISGKKGKMRGAEQGNFIRKIEFCILFGRGIPVRVSPGELRMLQCAEG